ncbi:unnamed protein product [Lymnaea stagnalis]|uniref:Uncharacterized protein n=1 Tax=Lymnaea stagnalis TaxID=6523 RepID=A0AAV2I1W6_LYMST
MSDNGYFNSDRLRFLKNWRFRFGLSVSSFSVSIGVVILVLTAHPGPPQTAVKMVVEGENSPIQFEPVCVDCAKLFKNPFYTYLNDPLFVKLHTEIRDGHRQCCINDTDQMAILVDMITILRREKTT